MASIRLSVGMKEQIERRLIHYRFSEEAQQLVADYAQLASDVYDDVYPEITQKKMEALPKGWLPTTGEIGAQFGETGSSYTNLSFGGQVLWRDQLCWWPGRHRAGRVPPGALQRQERMLEAVPVHPSPLRAL